MLIRQVTYVLALVCLVSTTAFAQGSAVNGRVTDPQGGAVRDATVTLIASNGSTTGTARTSDDGAFSLADVAPGSYVLQVEAAGFQRWSMAVSNTAPAI